MFLMCLITMLGIVAYGITTQPPPDTATIWHPEDGVRLHRVWTTHDVCYVAVSDLGGMAKGKQVTMSCLRGQ